MKCESKEVIRKDSRAQTLYEKVGFRVVGVRPNAFALKDGTMKKTYLMRLCIDSWLFFIRRMNTEALRWLHELMIFTFAAVEYQ